MSGEFSEKLARFAAVGSAAGPVGGAVAAALAAEAAEERARAIERARRRVWVARLFGVPMWVLDGRPSPRAMHVAYSRRLRARRRRRRG